MTAIRKTATYTALGLASVVGLLVLIVVPLAVVGDSGGDDHKPHHPPPAKAKPAPTVAAKPQPQLTADDHVARARRYAQATVDDAREIARYVDARDIEGVCAEVSVLDADLARLAHEHRWLAQSGYDPHSYGLDASIPRLRRNQTILHEECAKVGP